MEATQAVGRLISLSSPSLLFFSNRTGSYFSLFFFHIPYLLPSTSLSNIVSWMYGVWSHQPLEIGALHVHT